MDPVTHTFTGAALADAGLRRGTPLAAAALVLAANVPDVDILTYLGGEYHALAHRRGWTHGLPAMAVWPFVVTGLILAWDRLVRLRRDPGLPPVRPRTMLLVSAVGVLTHPGLDWLNTYGMRWLVPFSDAWTYGDAVFIIDPWIWLCLGGALFLRHSLSRKAVWAWAVFWAAGTLLVLGAPPVPRVARVLWIGWLALLVVRRMGLRGSRRTPGTGLSRLALGATAVYMGVMILASRRADGAVRAAALDRGMEVQDVMVAPEPANPFGAGLLVAEKEGYRRGVLRNPWNPRIRFDEWIPRSARGSGVGVQEALGALERARRDEEARAFLTWSRFPFYRVDRTDGGYRVRIGDARYADAPGAGGLAGLTVEVQAP